MNELGKLIRQTAADDLRHRRAEDNARPIGEKRIDVGFYDQAQADKLYESYRGDEIQWSAILVKWTGDNWKRVRRLTGPMEFEAALNECSRFCRQRGMERVR